MLPVARASIRHKVLNTPMPAAATMQTPMPAGWKNAEFGGAFATVVRKAEGLMPKLEMRLAAPVPYILKGSMQLAWLIAAMMHQTPPE